MITEMECVLCHYYDSMEGICNKTKELMRGDYPGCDSFIYYQTNFNMDKKPDDSFSFFLGDEARYFIEGRKDENIWLCFMSDTLNGDFMTMHFRTYFNITKEECIKKFLVQLQEEMKNIQSLLQEDFYEITKKEYLDLMDKKKEVE